MTTVFDLPWVLVEEILSKIPLGSMSAMRCTCKRCALSKTQIFNTIATAARKQMFMVMDSKVFSMRFDVQGIRNPWTKQISMFDQVEILQIFHCDGLLLCLIKDKRWRVVWNPYLGEIRWIQPINKSHKFHPSDMYGLGYDHNRDHKILRFLSAFAPSSLLPFFEIYDFNSNSWRVLDVSPECDIRSCESLKGNTYSLAASKETRGIGGDVGVFFLCFDFTSESFGPHLPLPFHSFLWWCETVALSCVRYDQLVVLCHHRDYARLDIWVTTKIEPNAVSWSNFLKVDMNPFSTHIPRGFRVGSFFIDEERKVVVVSHDLTMTSRYQTAYIIGQDGYFNSVNIGEARREGFYEPLVFASYVPSLVQVQLQNNHNQRGKRKERDYYDF